MSISSQNIANRGIVDLLALGYTGAFGRTPDQGGLNYYVDEILTGKLTVHSLLETLTNSPEFLLLHAGKSPAEVIASFYLNILGREPDPDGLTYWLNSGDSYAEIIYNMGIGEEAVAYNAPGLHRFEDLASKGMVDTVTALDNSPVVGETITITLPGETVFVPVPGPVVEVPVFVPVDQPDPVFKSHGTLTADSPFSNEIGGQYLGDGTTPSSGLVSAFSAEGLYVDMSMRPRQTDGNVYRPHETEVSGNTIKAEFHTFAGAQAVAHGSFADNPARAATAEAFTVGTGNMTFQEAYAAGFLAKLALDSDPTAGINYNGTTFQGAVQGDGTLDWMNTTIGAPNIIDNGGNANVAGNSTLVSFLPGGMANTAEGNQFTNHIWWEKDGVEVVGVIVTHTLVNNGHDLYHM